MEIYSQVMVKTNADKLIEMALQGKVVPADEFLPHEVSHDGKPYCLPGVGSITYNVKVGASAFGWKSDHTEPGVSTVSTESEKAYAKGYNFLACIGNEARVITGDAKGAVGIVTGKHGGVEHVMIDFADSALKKLTLDDKFLIRAFGQGLEIENFPAIKCLNLSPALFEKMKMREEKGRLVVGVTHILPAKIMGSGIGSLSCLRGDYDITTQDLHAVTELGLETIRLGDIIAIEDADNSYGRCYKKGAVSIAVVVHTNSFVAGHGPGVTTLLTCPKKAMLKPVINKHANIAELFHIGTHRK